jgi:hypothetical protein
MRALLIAALALAAISPAARAHAQTWSSMRTGPALWQIVSIDRTGEPDWPYGAEDIAGDGPAQFAADEAGADVRSIYADADGERLWLRAYLAGSSQPAASLAAFFFVDLDAREDTGGPADADLLEPTLTDDPTRGGYERALGMRGDGTVLGAWEWNAEQRAWLALSTRPMAIRAELGRARDPLAIGALEHGYVQLDIEHAIAGLNASCGGKFFVRTRNLAAAPRAFGDDDRAAAACRAPSDVYGDPVVVRSFSCRADAQCPNSGRCRDGVCLFAYDCSSAADCRAGARCTVNQCVVTVDRTCTSTSECGGLVCESGACVTCLEGGSRACAAGLACSPNGSCVDPGVFAPGADESGLGKVQGGAFSCATASQASSGAPLSLLLAISLFALSRRRMRPPAARAAAKRQVRGA